MQKVNVDVQLINGDKYEIVYDEGKEKFLDLVRFGEGIFLETKYKSFIAVKNIIAFKFTGE